MGSSSSKKPRRSYDVFLSFRGPDVRNHFLSHLYVALDQVGISTYIDSEELRKGEQISPALMKAIKESQIAVVVFSENYASSTWCLEEITKIMECKEQRGLMVFPVFYKVEPREVRGQRQGYAEAMAKHEIKFGKDSEKVKRWKKALLDAGSLSGWHFMDGYEAGLIQHIVQEISTQLDRTPLSVAKYPVGIDSRVQELQTILNLQSKDDILMVGLWGQGGVGKTTLAKAIYNAVFREFGGSSFLERVRENSKNSNDLVHLQEKLLSEVLLGKKLKVFSVGEGSQLIQDRLCNKKVLVILDDVDDKRQLNTLAGNCEWFGKGSRIIFTTRNKHLLTSHGVDSDHIYEVEALNDGEALELFGKHAFLRSHKIEISRNLVDRVLHYARGLPLALVVLGSFLWGRGEPQWKSTLQNLSRSPIKKISDVLKVSYDGLEDYVKEIFLDIACFFKGQETKYIKKVLNSCDFNMTIGVEILIERSLISEERGTLQMHPLMQLMGEHIVKEESHHDPSKRSRLWHYDDVLDVLSINGGTDAIKAIVLKPPEPEEAYICPNDFTNMRELRLLILKDLDILFQGPIRLPNRLRWLECPNCALIPEFGDGPKKLVGLDMRNSKIKEAPKQFKNSRRTKLNWASKVLQSSVQGLIFHGDSSIPKAALTTSLQSASISTSTVRREPLQTSSSKNCRPLEIARVSHTAGVSEWTSLANPWISTPLQSRTRPATAPSSESSVFNPSTLISSTSFAGGCQLGGLAVGPPEWLLSNYRLGRAQLSPAPGCIEGIWDQDFKELKFINLSECQWLYCMPNLDWTPNLVELDLHGCKNLERSHESVACHGKLQLLNLSGCSKLHHLPNVLQSKNLQVLNLNHCSKLQRFPDIPDKIKGLRELYLIGTSIEELPTSIENLVSLKEMDLRYCEKLAILPSSIYRLLNLERLMLEGCSKLFKFPKKEEVPSDSHMKMGFPNLYVLNLRGCNLLEVDFLENHSCFPFLRALYLLGNNFTKLPPCEHLHNLLWLDVSYCQQLQEIPQIPRQLSHLWAIGRESISKFPFNKCDFEGIDFIFLS